MLRTEILTGAEWHSKLKAPWAELMSNAREPSPSQGPAWIGAWWEVFGRGRKPLVWSLWQGRDLVGLWPLYANRGPFRAIRAMGTGASDYLHPLFNREIEPSAVFELLDYLRAGVKTDYLDLHQIRETTPLGSGLESGKLGEQATCLVLDLPSTFANYQQTLNKSLRYETRRAEKAPFSTGDARIWHPDTIAEQQQAFGILVDLHGKRWRKRGLPGSFASRRVRTFHEKYLAAAEPGEVGLRILFRGDLPIGAIYTMLVQGTAFYFQAGFDPRAKAESPGTVLVSEAIRESIECGATRFDFMRGDEPYKRRWKPQHEVRNIRIVRSVSAVVGPVASSTQHALGRLAFRIQSKWEG